jgi:hypothetical protein
MERNVHEILRQTGAKDTQERKTNWSERQTGAKDKLERKTNWSEATVCLLVRAKA